MPIDPNIALSVQAPQMPNLGQSLLQGQQMALQRQQMLSLQAERDAQTQDIQQKTLAAQALARNNAAIDDIMKTAFTSDPDTGAMLLNTNAIQQGMVKANLGHLWPQMSESIDKMNQSAIATNTARRKQLAENLWAVQQAPDAVKPHAALTAIAGLKANNVMTPDHAQSALQQLGPQPTVDAVNAMVQQYGAALPEFQALKTKYEADQAALAETKGKAAQANAAAGKDIAATAQMQRQQDLSMLAAQPTAQAYAAAYGQLPPERTAQLPQPQAWNANTPKQLLRMGMTPDQIQTNILGWANLQATRDKTAAELAMQDPSSPKNQERMEQNYAGMLKQEFSASSRTGLGQEDQRVNSAKHLLAIFDQHKDPATGQYNIPQSQYGELALGLAKLTSPGGQPGIEVMRELQQPTAAGALARIGSYVIGTPLTASTQDVFNMYHDAIIRQGNMAQQNRDTLLNGIKQLAPTDLNPARKARLEQAYANLNVMPSATPSAGVESPAHIVWRLGGKSGAEPQ